MVHTQFDKVEQKLEEARFHLAKLRDISSTRSFYPTVNAFLAASRGALSVLSYQFGTRELLASPKGKKLLASLSPAQRSERDRFDVWMKTAGAAALKHPLKDERDEAIHRSGQPGFLYYPKPGPGMTMHPGNAFTPARVAYGKGRVGLPLTDRNTFVYVSPDGSQEEAGSYCQTWLSMIEELVSHARTRPW